MRGWHRTVVALSVFTSVARAQSLTDPHLRVQSYVGGFDAPTGAVFLNDQGDLLITQKNDGRVILVRNRRIAGTALDLPVANDSERGLLSIALSPNFASDNFVYLYHTAAGSDGGSPISNKVSRYRLAGDQLVFDRKILDLPPGPGPNHDGGKLMFDAKGKLYVVIGDVNRRERTQNFETSSDTTRSGAILRIQPNGNGVASNPFNANQQTNRTRGPLADIYAYGIRNSFGLAFDPLTGNLWDTENGPDRMDEINLVRPGFNSGWRDVMGPSSLTPLEPGSLVMLGDNAQYSDPELSWTNPVGPTDLHFYEGSRLGSAYRNDLFVGDVNTGSLCHFDLTSARRSLRLTGPLADYLVNNEGTLTSETDDILLGEGFGTITDILTGPGGMFVLSLTDGRLFRIQADPGAAPMSVMDVGATVMLPEPALGAMTVSLCAIALRLARRDRT